MPNLFDPITYGSIEANNRIVMAPLTRARATREGVPTDIMPEYYALRADAGLIISEATGVNRAGLGWAFAPGIYTKEQTEHWKPVTKAVHDKGGKIILQLWHMGRATHSNVIGQQPVSSSATTYPTLVHTYDGKKEPEEAHALTVDEIKQTVKDYASATKNALEAGFDGVQIHAANGYLIDQFLRDSANFRTDEYGGSIENRLRFLTEVVEAVISVAGAERTSVRLSPNGDSQGVIDSNHVELFTAAAKRLNDLKVSMLELREVPKEASFWVGTDQRMVHPEIRQAFKGKLVLNQQYTRDEANEAIEKGTADAISFGRPFIGNPDLVEKLRKNEPWREYSNQTQWWYSQSREGYLDFP